MREGGAGADWLGIRAGTALAEAGGHRTLFTVEKWDVDQLNFARRRIDRLGHRRDWEPGPADFARLRVAPFETYAKDNANFVLDSGWQMLMNGVAGSSVTKFSTSGPVGRIGGGDTATAAAYTQTDLAAATGTTHRCWELLSANPTVGSTHSAGLIFAATFPTGDGNFAWAEFGVDSGTAQNSTASVAPMFSRGVASPGTKTSAQVWNATVTVTWT